MKKDDDVPCSITSSLEHFPQEEASIKEEPTRPPQNPPTNLTVVTVEGCPTFVILDWEKPDNDTVTGWFDFFLILFQNTVFQAYFYFDSDFVPFKIILSSQKCLTLQCFYFMLLWQYSLLHGYLHIMQTTFLPLCFWSVSQIQWKYLSGRSVELCQHITCCTHCKTTKFSLCKDSVHLSLCLCLWVPG